MSNVSVAMGTTKLNSTTKDMQPRYRGMLQTVWGSAKNFMDSYHGTAEPERLDKSAESFKELSKAWKLYAGRTIV